MKLPHDLTGWVSVLLGLISVIGAFLGGLGFIIKVTFVRSFNELTDGINKLTAKLDKQDDRLDKHEVHLAKHDEQIKTLFEKERNHE
ncbi:hypothetical protein K8375_09730 [Weissella cibaria]|uniref:hypothetical protein n=1 Tax=Weissella cibaria TaxID=137591 RepID=UPI0015F41307|nr:hypothetical protein [Weissella cibaria]MBA5962987.1 hypothetical protein [Weissella cibaria]MBZ6070330.1 hypothetical protein [Weissella cibaria]